MSRLDDFGKDVPITPVNTSVAIPAPGQPAARNAFTDVTIAQLYFFMWKWLAASILFALPFWALAVFIEIVSRH